MQKRPGMTLAVGIALMAGAGMRPSRMKAYLAAVGSGFGLSDSEFR